VVQERQAREARRAYGGGTTGAGPYPGAQPAAPPSPQSPVSYGVEVAPGAGRPGVPVDGVPSGKSSEGPRPAVPPEGRSASGFVPPAWSRGSPGAA